LGEYVNNSICKYVNVKAVETHGRASFYTHGRASLEMRVRCQRRFRMYPMDAMPVNDVCENELTSLN
jgi:hypothetical protein